jgi:hypothetical protein
MLRAGVHRGFAFAFFACAFLAGCAASAASTAAPAQPSCPDPACPAAAPAAKPPAVKQDPDEKLRDDLARIRGPGSVTLEAKPDSPVRVRLESHGEWVLVEACVKEVAKARPGLPPFVRFTMRLCDGYGTTYGEELRPSRRPGRNLDAVPEGWAGDAVAGVPFHRYFACPGGTAWEVDAVADDIGGGAVRFTLLGEYRSCTK